ncbi:FAD-linked oxidoreductase-like protein [Ilyonectria destructans]|nr:FAD-linked oxidoreductase-like protein [Ilyonectria destructans]
MLLRSLLIATVSSHRVLLTPALSVLSFFSKPRKGLFNIEKNPLLFSTFKNTLYNHFCAGENVREVTSTIQQIKDMGFRGVILTYAREVVVDASSEGPNDGQQKSSKLESSESVEDQDIEAWRQGVLETVLMVGEGDFLALKFTGAGGSVIDALSSGKVLPAQMIKALDEICENAVMRQASILVDAEQQFVQPAIDNIAVELMRKYNRGKNATVYNTYQAYLKVTPQVLLQHLHLANDEGFTIGVKLVRGAYINSEPRRLINDTKEDTDNSYNRIASGLLQSKYEDLDKYSGSGFPNLELLLATHNKESALKAHALQKKRSISGLPLTKVQYGQLMGMADEVSCTLLQLKGGESPQERAASPEVYKCLSWGTLGDCMSYLLRRAVENRDAVSRTKTEYLALRGETWRRLKKSVGLA